MRIISRQYCKLSSKIMELSCKVQNYAWGKIGSESLVAKLKSTSDKSFAIDEKVPYAELWMGTHVNGPSVIKNTKKTLAEVVKENPECLGSGIRDLPYLFKVLSVNQALSIQAHPNKKHAEELHSKYPDVYKDPNHKPELAIALTPFEALCGFRHCEEIRQFITDVPELTNVIGKEIIEKLKSLKCDIDFLKVAFRGVLSSKTNVTQELTNLVERLGTLGTVEKEKYNAELIQRLHLQYPNDAGCFMVYFLNYLKLQPQEAIFLAANEPHAYLYGDCIECMACSDNVVRAGLTPKYIDVDTLCSMLTYKGGAPSEMLLQPEVEDGNTLLFKAPVPDFAVAQVKVAISVGVYKLKPRLSGSILIVISGEGKTEESVLQPGVVLFIPANKTLHINNVAEELLMYQAFTYM